MGLMTGRCTLCETTTIVAPGRCVPKGRCFICCAAYCTHGPEPMEEKATKQSSDKTRGPTTR